MTSVLKSIQPIANLNFAPTELTSLTSFIETFPLQGESLYSIVFNRNIDIIQTQKARFAVANLEKILTATFAVSATSGFDRMSLRDLSRQTGMSMGSIYSCISKKEDIALMIADVVRLSSELTRQHAMKSDSMWSKIEQSIRFHLYASTLLQPWYFFLYFETRCLPEEQQRESKKIELDGIRSFEAQIQTGVDAGEFYTSDARMVANTIVVLLEDWYLKPWKTLSPWKTNISIEQQEKQINNYSRSIVELVRKLLADS
jgi:AcrR family transcriptional regulator